MTTVELEPVITESTEVDEGDHDDPIECHLYVIPDETMCGIPTEQDRHPRHGVKLPWSKGQTACPVCSAPLCVHCLLLAS